MKKYFFILFLFSCSFNNTLDSCCTCNNTPSKIILNENDEIYPAPNNVKKTFNPNDEKSLRFTCKKIKKENAPLVMKHPNKIAVSKNGENIYFLNTNCTFYNYQDNSLTYELCEKDILTNNNGSYSRKAVYDSNFIYKIDKNKKLSILDSDEILEHRCNFISELTVDDMDNLYFSDFIYHKIFKIKEEKCVEYVYNTLDGFNPPENRETEILGPVNLIIKNSNIIYYNMFSPEFGNYSIISQVNLEKKERIKYEFNNSEQIYFSVYKDIINTYSDENNLFTPQINSLKRINRSKYLGSIINNSKGDTFLANQKDNIVYKLNSSKDFIPFVGSGIKGYKDGKGTEAQFNGIGSGLAIDMNDNLYITDILNNAIRKITPEATVTTIYKEKEL